MSEIIKTGTPSKDLILDNGLKWNVEGVLNGKGGICELVVGMDSKKVVHFFFNSK